MVQLPDENRLQFKVTPGLRNLALALIGIGLALTLLQIALPWHPHHEEAGAAAQAATEHHGYENPRLFMSLHLGLLLAVPLGASGLFFLLYNHLAGAAWSVTIRRIAENYVWFLVFALVLMIVIFFAGNPLHPSEGSFGQVFHHWVHAPETDELINHKQGWLSTGFFIGRNIVILLVWIGFGYMLHRLSVNQDSTGSISNTRSMVKISAVGAVIFALTFSASAWDLSMSLEPHWFSTMWAVYIFAGMGLTLYATLILWIWYLKKNGYYGESLNENHIHDLSKFMFGHTVFWGYIAVSQFLLIWYAHIPEETIFYAIRGGYEWTSGWAYVSLLLVVLRFVAPFLLIIKREPKRNLNYMAGISILILVGQVVDMYWIAYPTLSHGDFVMFSWQELGAVALVAGSFIFIVGTALARASLIPKKDPRLEECLHFHQ